MPHEVLRRINRADGRNDGVFQRGIAHTQPFIGDVQHLVHREIARHGSPLDVRIHPDFVPHLAAEHFPDGAVVILPLDVPHRLLDAADCREHQRTAAVEAAAIERLHVMLDLHRVFADEVILKFADNRLNRGAVPLQYRLSQSHQIGIGVHLQKHPTGSDLQKLQPCNFHILISSPKEFPDRIAARPCSGTGMRQGRGCRTARSEAELPPRRSARRTARRRSCSCCSPPR